MKQVKVEIKTSVETTLGGKPVNELLKNIADLCHERLEYSSSKNKGCEILYEERTKSMKITEMIWRTGYLFLKVRFVGYWICWRTKI